MSETEENEWKRLSRVFSIEVPEDEAVQQKQNDCRRIDELNSKRETKTTVLQPIQKQETTKSGSTMALIAVGTVLIVAGVICFVLSKIAVGAVLSVVGFAVLLVAFWTHTKQKPFVLLDDPFVNLDDEHTERALEMLKEIAKNKQVVYMVCNSSWC